MAPAKGRSRRLALDLGCGKAKTPGFFGGDRLALPGVDVVLDLDRPLPFATSSVDLVVMSHSLEHARDVMATLREVYRVCRDGAQVCIVAPYYNQGLNLANPYHLQAFNEHTPRFWTDAPGSAVPPEEYYHPHAPEWGLSRSDHSDPGIDFRCLRMEFFYFPEYRSLPAEEQRAARKKHQDVCDQVMYQLVVAKRPAGEDEMTETTSETQLFEPPYVTLRKTVEKADRFAAELVAAGERIGSLEAELATAGAGIRSLEAELVTAGERFRSLEVELTTAGERARTLEAELVTAGERFRSLEAELTTAGERVRSLEAELATAGERIRSLEAKLAAAERKTSLLEASLQSAEQAISEAVAERDRARLEATRLGELSLEFDRLQSRLADRDVELARVWNELADRNAEITALESDLAVGRAGLAARTAEADTLRSHLARRDADQSELTRKSTALADEVDLFRRRRLTRWLDRLDRSDAREQVGPAFRQLLDDGVLFQDLRGFRLRPGPDLRDAPFLAYPLPPLPPGLRGLLLAPLLDLPQAQGTLGIEIVSAEGRIVAQAVVPLAGIGDAAPARISFPALGDLGPGLAWLRVFVRDARTPVRVFEWHRYDFAGLGHGRRRPFCGFVLHG